MSTVIMTEPIPLGSPALPGDLVIPAQALGLVVFAHGSGSGRLSPRNQWVARALQQAHLATLLFDLLTEEEARDRRLVFDIDLLAQRVVESIHWTEHHPELAHLRLGLFGASTGAAAALVAAANRPDRVAALVSRGGRPDLALASLSSVQAPTLLIVGGLDTEVLELNRQAMRLLTTQKRLEVIPGAGHLFEEPGALSSVAALAASWFQKHLATRRDA